MCPYDYKSSGIQFLFRNVFNMLKSHSQYLVRNQVLAAYQQDLVVQGVKCVLYKVLSVYCTSLPYIVHGMQSLL